jgi:hypothetical protein
MALKSDIDLAALVTGAFLVRNAFIVIGIALFGLGVFALTMSALIVLR